MAVYQKPEPLFDQAVHQFINQREGNNLDEIETWLNDEEHRLEFEKVADTWDALDLLEADLFPELEAYDADHSSDQLSDADALETVSHHQAWWKTPITAWSSALAVVIALVVIPIGYFGIPQSHMVEKGSQLELLLNDGSHIALSSNTKLTVQEGWGKRAVAIERGNAFFTVTPNSSKPFTIDSGNTQITVLGTAFNIYRKGEHVEVTVENGKVNLYRDSHTEQQPFSVDLTKNQRATVSHQGKVTIEKEIDTEKAVAWKNGYYYFTQEPLSLIIERMSDFYASPIYIMSKKHRELKLSGAFKTDDFDNFLMALQSITEVKIERNSAGAVLIF